MDVWPRSDPGQLTAVVMVWTDKALPEVVCLPPILDPPDTAMLPDGTAIPLMVPEPAK